MKFGVVNKSTILNSFVIHTLQRNITHLAVLTCKTNIILGVLKGGGAGKEPKKVSLKPLRGGGYVLRWWGGGGVSWGGGGCFVEVKSWSKMLFLGTFWKINKYCSPLDERVRSSFAEKRNVESGTSTREDRSKTAQKPLKSCLKNCSKITAKNERFLSGFF